MGCRDTLGATREEGPQGNECFPQNFFQDPNQGVGGPKQKG